MAKRVIKSGEKRKNLFKKGDLVVWRHWRKDPDHPVLSSRNVLVEDRGIVLKVASHYRSNMLSDGSSTRHGPSECWRALVLFTHGQQTELPLVCLEKLN